MKRHYHVYNGAAGCLPFNGDDQGAYRTLADAEEAARHDRECYQECGYTRVRRWYPIDTARLLREYGYAIKAEWELTDPAAIARSVYVQIMVCTLAECGDAE